MPEEVPLGEDCRDWAQKLTEHERNLLTQIFRFFTQADVEVQDCYHDKYGRVFKPTEVKMMLAAFSNMETVHIAAYAHLLDTIGMPESESWHVPQYKEMKDKHDYLQPPSASTRRGHRPHARHVRRLHRGAAAVRQLRDADELPALQQDEGHGPDRQLERARREPALRGHHQAVPRLRQGADCVTKAVRDDIVDCCQDGAAGGRLHRPGLRDGPGPGHDARGDQEVHPLHRRLAPAASSAARSTRVDEHPLPWLQSMLNGVEHANFFEARATEYSKAATRGNMGAHLYLWVPNALLLDGLQVMKAWGFDYKTNLIWHKVRKDGGPDGRGVGFYFRNVTEIILFGTRGKGARTRSAGRSQVNFLATRKREHSRKPDELYEIIEACSFAPRLEIFARGPRAGWRVWGNQAEVYDIAWATYAHNSASERRKVGKR
jgi:ribonucleoside-diphosphate reductase beta chain